MTKTTSHPEVIADGCVGGGGVRGVRGSRQTDPLSRTAAARLEVEVAGRAPQQQAPLFLPGSQTLGLTDWCFGVGGTQIQQVPWKKKNIWAAFSYRLKWKVVFTNRKKNRRQMRNVEIWTSMTRVLTSIRL